MFNSLQRLIGIAPTLEQSVIFTYGVNGLSLRAEPGANLNGILTGHGRSGPFATFVKSPQVGGFTLQAHNGHWVRIRADNRLVADMLEKASASVFIEITQAATPSPPTLGARGGGLLEVLVRGGNGYVAIDINTPSFIAHIVPDKNNATLFRIIDVAASAATTLARQPTLLPLNRSGTLASSSASSSSSSSSLLPKLPCEPLSAAQRNAFRTDGYFIVKHAVGPRALAVALRYVLHSIGAIARGTKVHGLLGGAGDPSSTRIDTGITPLLGDDESIISLFTHTRVGAIAAGLCPALKKVRAAQIAPRYPEPLPEQHPSLITAALLADRAAEGSGSVSAAVNHGDPLSSIDTTQRTQGSENRWHCDGMDKEKSYPFSALVSVALSDALTEDAGNFTVFPASHRVINALIAEHGERHIFGKGAERPALTIVSSQTTTSTTAAEEIRIKPVMLKVEAGDAVFVHPLLAHRIGINYTSSIRHALFFRITHSDHERLRENLLRGELYAELDV